MGAHERILEDTGVAFQPESQARGRAPFPRARHVEAVVVDDRVSLTAVPAGTRTLPAVAERSFREGGEALRHAGLGVHPDKGVLNAKHAAPLGIEIDGVRGLAGAERLRRHQLAHLSLALGRQGRCMVGRGATAADLLMGILPGGASPYAVPARRSLSRAGAGGPLSEAGGRWALLGCSVRALAPGGARAFDVHRRAIAAFGCDRGH